MLGGHICHIKDTFVRSPTPLQLDYSKLNKREEEFAISAQIKPNKFPKKHCECKGCSARRCGGADIFKIEPELTSFLKSAGLRMEATSIGKQFAEFGEWVDGRLSE